MEPTEKKVVVEAFESHGVWNFSFIREVHCRFHIETEDLQNLRVCVNLVLEKPKHLYLVFQYKQIQIYEIYNAGVCDNNHKEINEGFHSFHIVPKKGGTLIMKGEYLLDHMIRFTHIIVGKNIDASFSYSIKVLVS